MRASKTLRHGAAVTCGAAAFAVAMLAALPGLAQEIAPMVGAPTAWGMGLQQSGGVVKDVIESFNQMVLYIIIAITVLVAGLLGYVAWRYSAAKNPTASRTSHHTVLEVAWTVVPVLILLVIAIPSFRLIYYQDRVPNADLTINVQGRQWYWHYAYPDNGNFAFDSYPLQEDQLPADQRHLFRLVVDNPLVVPIGANVRVITTGQDVIHSFFVPSLGVQKYTIPGRTLETWFRADRAGTFYGQCNQICGTNHWFMPIMVRAVPQAEFNAWVADARTRFAQAPAPDAAATVAAATNDTTLMAEARR